MIYNLYSVIFNQLFLIIKAFDFIKNSATLNQKKYLLRIMFSFKSVATKLNLSISTNSTSVTSNSGSPFSVVATSRDVNVLSVVIHTNVLQRKTVQPYRF